MSTFFEVWRRHLLLWAVPVGFCVLNLLAYVIYQSAFAGKVEGLERRYQQAVEQLEAIENERLVIQEFLETVESHRTEVQGLYRDRFQTESERFTRALQEIKSLAKRAGLEPSALSYPKQTFGEHRLVQRMIRFSVTGSYEQLRKFINFLELTDHFFTLQRVTLGDGGDGGGGKQLSINLEVSTIFSARKIAAPEPAEEVASGNGAAPAEGDAPEEETLDDGDVVPPPEGAST